MTDAEKRARKRESARKAAAKQRAERPDHVRAIAKRHRENNRDKLLQRQREWSLQNPDYWSRYTYGIGKAEIQTLLEVQNGCCAICDKTFGKYYLDHGHETGAVRGLLCNLCNLGLGHFGDDIRRLGRAADYLEQHEQ